MKNLTKIVSTFSILCLACQALAAEYLFSRDNTVQTNAVVSFPGAAGKQVVLRSLDVTGDNADAVIQFAGGTVKTSFASDMAIGETNLIVASTNGLGSGQGLLLLHHVSTGTREVLFYYSVGTGSVQTYPGVAEETFENDVLWWCSDVATNAIGSATVRLDGTLFATRVNAPLILRLYTGAGTAERINRAVVEYTRYP